jgi:formylmethanofuran dehydrogenase subunit E
VVEVKISKKYRCKKCGGLIYKHNNDFNLDADACSCWKVF